MIRIARAGGMATRTLQELGAVPPMARAAWARPIAALTGLALGTGLGLETARDDPSSVLIAFLVVVLLIALVMALLPARLWGYVLPLLAAGFAARVLLAAMVFAYASAVGRGGFVTGDDAGYAVLSWGWVQYLRDMPQPPYVPPHWNGDDYLFGPFVYMESALFFLFGRHVVLMEIVNAGFFMAAAALFADIARRLFTERAARLTFGLIASYPSLILWSALNLKEALVIFLVAATLWSLIRARSDLRFGYVLLATLCLIPLKDSRLYVYLALAALIPTSMLFLPASVARLRWTALSAIAVLAVVLLSGVPAYLATDALGTLDQARRNNASGARTAFEEPAPVVARAGDTFVIVGPPEYGATAAPDARILYPSGFPDAFAASCSPSRTVAVIEVQLGTRLILAPCGTGSLPPAPPSAVYVRPGDIIVIAGTGGTPAPADQRRILRLYDLRSSAPAAQISPAGTEGDRLVIDRTVQHLPKGVVYALFAPFPWETHSLSELAASAELVLWYPILVAAGWSVWRRRGRRGEYLPIALAALAFLGVLALAEGNVGGLFRHRATVIPLAIVLASPSLSLAFETLRKWQHRARWIGPATPSRTLR